jgi:AcrR family transcriptional regulator
VPRVSAAYRDAMRERLLGAAASAFVRLGYEGTTVREILSEAKVAPATLYAYFGGKDEIIDALAERAIAASADSLGAVDALGAPDDEGADRLFRWVLRSTLSHAFPSSELLAELRSRSTRGGGAAMARRLNRAIVAASRPFVERLQARGQIDVVDIDAMVELLDIIHDGMAHRAASRTFATSFSRVGQVCVDVLSRGTIPGLSGAPPP